MADKAKKKKTTTSAPAKETRVKKTAKVAKEATKKAATKATAKTKTVAKVTKPRKAVKTVAASPVKEVKEKVVETAAPKRRLKIRKSYVILAAVLIALGAFLYFFRSLFVAAVVNGQPISRLAVVEEAEKQSGKQALNNLVRNALIEQEASKQKVTVSEKEIDEEVKKVEQQLSKQGQKLDQVLEMQGMTQDDLRNLIRLDKLVGKLVGKDIKVTDKQVADYIEQNKETLPQDMKEDELKKTVQERLKQQQLSEKVQAWLENLQKNANVNYFVQY